MNGRSSTKASNCGTTQRATCALEVTSHVTMTSRYMKHDNAIDRETRKTHDLNDGYTADMLKDGRKVARHSTECDVRGKAWFRHASLSVSQETRLRMAGAGRIHARIVRECRAHGPLLQNRNASSAGGRSQSTCAGDRRGHVRGRIGTHRARSLVSQSGGVRCNATRASAMRA